MIKKNNPLKIILLNLSDTYVIHISLIPCHTTPNFIQNANQNKRIIIKLNYNKIVIGAKIVRVGWISVIELKVSDKASDKLDRTQRDYDNKIIVPSLLCQIFRYYVSTYSLDINFNASLL